MWQLRRRVHPSWLIALVSLCIVIGTAIVPYIDHALFNSLTWLVASLGMIVIILWKRTIYLLPIVIVAGLLIGLWRGSVLDGELAVYQQLYGKSVEISGTVSDDPDVGERGESRLRLTHLSLQGERISGKLWASLDRAGDIKRGDIVVVSGVLDKGFGGFAAVIYKADLNDVRRPEPGDVARQLRDGFADKVRTGIDDPQASLGLGYLLGQKRALPPELEDALVVTGLTHIVVASGYNLTILVRFARRLFVNISKYLATLASGGMIFGFIAVTGASPSMSRAGLVAGLSLAAWYYGRRFHPLVLLPFAAAVTVIIDPTYAWNDLGWQLSFAAFAGVMILAPLLQRYFFGDKKPGTIRQILGETISASILTLPILVLSFGLFSNVAILTNLLILPLVPFAMLLTFVSGVGAIILPGLAPVMGVPAELLLTYMITVIEYFAALPWAQTVMTIQPWVAGVSYLAIIGLCVYLSRQTKYDLRDSNIIE